MTTWDILFLIGVAVIIFAVKLYEHWLMQKIGKVRGWDKLSKEERKRAATIAALLPMLIFIDTVMRIVNKVKGVRI